MTVKKIKHYQLHSKSVAQSRSTDVKQGPRLNYVTLPPEIETLSNLVMRPIL
jgi:hypothetical protein